MNEDIKKQVLDILQECADLLNEVRTGEDFECKCWDAAERTEALIKKLPGLLN